MSEQIFVPALEEWDIADFQARVKIVEQLIVESEVSLLDASALKLLEDAREQLNCTLSPVTANALFESIYQLFLIPLRIQGVISSKQEVRTEAEQIVSKCESAEAVRNAMKVRLHLALRRANST